MSSINIVPGINSSHLHKVAFGLNSGYSKSQIISSRSLFQKITDLVGYTNHRQALITLYEFLHAKTGNDLVNGLNTLADLAENEDKKEMIINGIQSIYTLDNGTASITTTLFGETLPTLLLDAPIRGMVDNQEVNLLNSQLMVNTFNKRIQEHVDRSKKIMFDVVHEGQSEDNLREQVIIDSCRSGHKFPVSSDSPDVFTEKKFRESMLDDFAQVVINRMEVNTKANYQQFLSFPQSVRTDIREHLTNAPRKINDMLKKRYSGNKYQELHAMIDSIIKTATTKPKLIILEKYKEMELKYGVTVTDDVKESLNEKEAVAFKLLKEEYKNDQNITTFLNDYRALNLTQQRSLCEGISFNEILKLPLCDEIREAFTDLPPERKEFYEVVVNQQVDTPLYSEYKSALSIIFSDMRLFEHTNWGNETCIYKKLADENYLITYKQEPVRVRRDGIQYQYSLEVNSTIKITKITKEDGEKYQICDVLAQDFSFTDKMLESKTNIETTENLRLGLAEVLAQIPV